MSQNKLKNIERNTKESSTKQHKIHKVMKEAEKYDPQWGEKSIKIKCQKLGEKNIKIAIMNIFHMFQKTEKSMNAVRRNMKDVKMP